MVNKCISVTPQLRKIQGKMSREDREGFIVKFVESHGQKTEYSVKAYEVRL